MTTRMKKIMKISGIGLIVVVVAGVAMMAVAQQQMHKSGMGMFGFMAKRVMTPDFILARFADQLKLTDEQKTKLRPILQDAIDQGMAEFGKRHGRWGHGQGMSEKGDAHATMWQGLEGKLAEILTPEQMQQLQATHAKSMGMRMEMFGRMMQTRGQFRQLFADLNLSETQTQQLFDVFLKYRDNRRGAVDQFIESHKPIMAMFLNENFDENKVRQTFRETTAKFEDAVVTHAKMVYEMKAILTPEQLQLLQQKAPELLNQVQQNLHTGQAMIDLWLQPAGK